MCFLNSRKQTVPLTWHQLFVGLWRRHFLLPQDSKPPSVCTQVNAGMFAIYTTWPLGMRMTTALARNLRWHLCCTLIFMYIYSLPKTFDGLNQTSWWAYLWQPCFREYLLDLSNTDCWRLRSTLAELGICLCTEQVRWILFPISYFRLTLGVCEYCTTKDLNDESILLESAVTLGGRGCISQSQDPATVHHAGGTTPL